MEPDGGGAGVAGRGRVVRGGASRVRRTAGIALGTLLTFGACSGPPKETAKPAGEEAAAPGSSPKTLVWGLAVQPDLLNPLLSTSAIARDIDNLVFLRLTEFGPPPELDFEPLLAESWTFEDGGRTLIYELRRDVKWEDGTPVTAADVVFTFERMTNPDVPYPNRMMLRKVDSCTADGEWTVRFRFRETPTEPLFETQFQVVPAHLLRDVPLAELRSNVFGRAPTGCGRWRVAEWVFNEKIVLEANPDTPLGRPLFDRIVFRIIPDDNTMRTELLTGGVDVIHRYPSRFLREDEKNAALTFGKFPDRTYTYIGWNLKNPLFEDLRVRKALTLATDRRTIVDAFRDGRGQIVAVPLYPEHPDYDPNVAPLPFDPASAAALLDEAGWTERNAAGIRTKGGIPFEFEFLMISGNTISEEIATMVQAEFEKLGIGVTSQMLEYAVYLEKLHAKEFDATNLARTLDFVYDPESVFHSRSIGGQYNDVSFSSPVIDALIDRAKATANRTERRKVWWEFQERFALELPITLLYVGDAYYPVRRDKVENPVMDVRGALVNVHSWKPRESAS